MTDGDKAMAMLLRLAKYHGAEIAEVEGQEKRMSFRFSCGNEIMSWNSMKRDMFGCMRADYDEGCVTDPVVFLERYLSNTLFIKVNGDSGWSDEFNYFGKKKLKAGSAEELDLTLSALGY